MNAPGVRPACAYTNVADTACWHRATWLLVNQMTSITICSLAIMYLIGFLLHHNRHPRNICSVHGVLSFKVNTMYEEELSVSIVNWIFGLWLIMKNHLLEKDQIQI